MISLNINFQTQLALTMYSDFNGAAGIGLPPCDQASGLRPCLKQCDVESLHREEQRPWLEQTRKI
jgi:hypothetical protein